MCQGDGMCTINVHDISCLNCSAPASSSKSLSSSASASAAVMPSSSATPSSGSACIFGQGIWLSVYCERHHVCGGKPQAWAALPDGNICTLCRSLMVSAMCSAMAVGSVVSGLTHSQRSGKPRMQADCSLNMDAAHAGQSLPAQASFMTKKHPNTPRNWRLQQGAASETCTVTAWR